MKIIVQTTSAMVEFSIGEDVNQLVIGKQGSVSKGTGNL